jgi:two-component system alkaline phosphatase synthesis response regulator PhoP
MTNKHSILIIDDDKDITEFISYNLKKEGFDVKYSNNPIEGISLAKRYIPHLILLDIMMPDMNGMQVIEELKKEANLKNTIITFLTARSEEHSQIAGFEAGADDYITKPIRPKLLISRIKALLKRYNFQEDRNNTLIEIDNLKIDVENYTVYKDGEILTLPKKEFKLLLLFASNRGKVFSREIIYSKIWGDDIVVGNRTLDVHIRKLREHIGSKKIITIQGIGYKFS